MLKDKICIECTGLCDDKDDIEFCNMFCKLTGVSRDRSISEQYPMNKVINQKIILTRRKR